MHDNSKYTLKAHINDVRGTITKTLGKGMTQHEMSQLIQKIAESGIHEDTPNGHRIWPVVSIIRFDVIGEN